MGKLKDYGIILLFMLIGFASVTTTLILNGTLNIEFNTEDYEVYFSEAIIDGVNKSNTIINSNRQKITIEPKEFSKLGDESILNYEVTNNSTLYDAKVELNCKASNEEITKYLEINNSLSNNTIPAQTKEKGILTLTLKNAYAEYEALEGNFTCTIETNPVEKTEQSEIVVEDTVHYLYGILTDEVGKSVNNKSLVVYSEEPHYGTTDFRGAFLIENLEGGDHEIYITDKPEEELKNMTKEEIIAIASSTSTFNTSEKKFHFSNGYNIESAYTSPETPQKIEITFDAAEGTTEERKSFVIKGAEFGILPETEHETLLFTGWKLGEESINKSTIVKISENTTLKATYGNGIAKINEKNFRNLEQAFAYAKDSDTIELLGNTELSNDITNNHQVTLNLNDNQANFNEYKMINENVLTINQGSITSTGDNTIINKGTLTLNDGLTINKIDAKKTEELIDTRGVLLNESKAVAVVNNITVNDNIAYVYPVEPERRIDGIFKNYGELTINDGNYKISGTHVTILRSFSSSKATINKGIFDGRNANRSTLIETEENATLSIGKSNEEIELIGKNDDYYLASFKGTTSIIAGTITMQEKSGILITGNITIGSETTTPTIRGAEDYEIMDIKGTGIIYNANLYGNNAAEIQVYSGSSLEIINCNLEHNYTTSETRAIVNAGTITIQDGTYKIGEKSPGEKSGLITSQSGSTLNIKGGNFIGKESNTIYITAGATMNMGEKDKTIKISGNAGAKYTIASSGTINILDGITTSKNYNLFGNSGIINVGTSTTTPTIEGRMLIDNQKEANIYNANLIVEDRNAIYTFGNATTTIHNVNIEQNNKTSTNRAIHIASNGNFIMNDGYINAQGTSSGVLQIDQGGTATLNGGTFESAMNNTIIWSKEGAVLNIGASGKKVKFIGNENNTNYYLITAYGTTNIIDGEIIGEKGYLLNTSSGPLTIGSESTTPTIRGAEGFRIIDIEGTGTIYNANLYGNNNVEIQVHSGSNLDIINCNLEHNYTTSEPRAIVNAGTLTIQDGNYKIGEESPGEISGLITSQSGSTLNIKGGNFIGKESNTIYISTGATMNMGEKDKTINMSGNTGTKYTIVSYGTINILDGITTSNNYVLFGNSGIMNVGTSTTTPTIEGSKLIENRKETNIYNANLIGDDRNAIYTYGNATTTIHNANIEQNSKTYTHRAIYVASNGNFIMNDGYINAQGTSSGVLQIERGGTATLNGGTFESAMNGSSIYLDEGAVLNIGSSGKKVKFIGNENNTGYYIISSYGTTNIIDGEIIGEKGYLLNSLPSGTLTIGSESTTPTIRGAEGFRTLDVRGIATIHNANIYGNDSGVISIYSEGNLEIMNCNLVQNSISSVNRAISNSGTLTIHDGTYELGKESQSSYGIINANAGSSTTIESGIFDGSLMNDVLIYVNAGSSINIGKKDKKVTFISNSKNNAIIYNKGNTNIIDGEITVRNGYLINNLETLEIGKNGNPQIKKENDNNKVFIDNQKIANIYNGYIIGETSNVIRNTSLEDSSNQIIRIMGGKIENNDKNYPTIYMHTGKLEMTEGEVVNKAGGTTIYNKGGTVTKTGGIALNTYGVS